MSQLSHGTESTSPVTDIGARVTFDTDGTLRAGFVADRKGEQVRVMDVLEPLSGSRWSWSAWVSIDDIMEAER